MLGGLHIEITAFKTLGSWLNGSGWVDALTQSMVATAGTADSYLHCSHLTRTRYAHQVTSVALHMLQKDAFESTQPQQQMMRSVSPIGVVSSQNSTHNFSTGHSLSS